MNNDLTPKQKVFVDCLLASPSLSKTQAARQAGYADPRRSAFQVYRLPAVKNAVEVAVSARHQRIKIEADEVIGQLWDLLNADALEVFDDSESGLHLRDLAKVSSPVRRSIASLKVEEKASGSRLTEITFVDRAKLVELLMKHLGMLDI